MSLILNIETSGPSCSVALFKGTDILACKEDTETNRHSEVLNVWIEEVLTEAHIRLTKLDAIALSIGPGSYTGLRIGAATAKALAFVNQTPLVGYSCLESLYYAIPQPESFVLTTLDSRKNEIYAALYGPLGKTVIPPGPFTINQLEELLPNEKILVIGSGTGKLENINHPHLKLLTGFSPSAKFGGKMLQQLFRNKQFLKLASFEPDYMKKVHTTTPKKTL